MSLRDALNDPDKRPKVIDDCVAFVDSEAMAKSGLGGMVIKTGYKAVKGISPGFIRKVVDKLFDEWAEKLEPIWNEGEAKGSPVDHMKGQRSKVADALLSVTDAKADGAKSALVGKTYKKLRPKAKDHVEAAVPGLATLLAKYAG